MLIPMSGMKHFFTKMIDVNAETDSCHGLEAVEVQKRMLWIILQQVSPLKGVDADGVPARLRPFRPMLLG